MMVVTTRYTVTQVECSSAADLDALPDILFFACKVSLVNVSMSERMT